MDPSQIQGANLDLFLDGAEAPFTATVSINNVQDIIKVLSQRYGTTPVAHLVQGITGEIVAEFNEWDQATVRKCLSLTGSGPYLPPAIGSVLPAFPIRLHNPHDEDNTHDIVADEVVPMAFGMTVNGQGEKRFTVTFSMQLNAAGGTWGLGYTAPP